MQFQVKASGNLACNQFFVQSVNQLGCSIKYIKLWRVIFIFRFQRNFKQQHSTSSNKLSRIFYMVKTIVLGNHRLLFIKQATIMLSYGIETTEFVLSNDFCHRSSHLPLTNYSCKYRKFSFNTLYDSSICAFMPENSTCYPYEKHNNLTLFLFSFWLVFTVESRKQLILFSHLYTDQI